jgi:uncharacterized membrane protein SpoIIM required for sporulation
MREVAFIKQNKEKWLEFEKAISNKAKKNPDDIADLHIKIMNDLAYAQSFYPKSNVVPYLNKLAKISYSKVYHTKRVDKNPFLTFFFEKVPLLCYQYRKMIYLAFVVFFVFFFVGLISTFNEESFARQVLGDSYVDETLKNIRDGDTLAVYKGGSTWGSFIGIFTNNLWVGLRMFLSGILIGFGTGFYIVHNSIMVAVFQAFFYQQNSLWESVQGIWIHGTYEIFAMVIESAAGYIIGVSILFPGSLKRMESFKIGLRHAFYIFLSTIPFTLVAGFLEGYVTRLYNVMPSFVCYLIISFCLVTISYYYLILPYKVAKKHLLR